MLFILFKAHFRYFFIADFEKKKNYKKVAPQYTARKKYIYITLYLDTPFSKMYQMVFYLKKLAGTNRLQWRTYNRFEPNR
jgi:hypothetical protein